MFLSFSFFFFNAPATTVIYTLSLHDALPILRFLDCRSESFTPKCSVTTVRMSSIDGWPRRAWKWSRSASRARSGERSEEHTSELQSRRDLVCRLLLEKKKKKKTKETKHIHTT